MGKKQKKETVLETEVQETVIEKKPVQKKKVVEKQRIWYPPLHK